MGNTINEARTPGELAAWLRQWADGADASDHLDDNDARQLAEAVERVCTPGNAAAIREALRESCAILAVVDGGEYSGEIDSQLDKNTAALAAPARNCDVVRDENEALYRCRANVPVERDAAYDRGMRDAIRWLLAPAEKGAEK